jgi:hypothetical protein
MSIAKMYDVADSISWPAYIMLVLYLRVLGKNSGGMMSFDAGLSRDDPSSDHSKKTNWEKFSEGLDLLI